jgi:RsiW-degrading membrane proteinase PrsW (M82 family)
VGLIRRHLFLVVTVVVFAATLPMVVDGHWEEAGWVAGLSLFVLTWLLLLTGTTRGVDVLGVVRGWFAGYFTVVLVVLLVGLPLVSWLGEESRWRVGLAVPVVEELAKLLPLVVWIVVARRRKIGYTLSDLVALGAAVGAGFAFSEDVTRGRVAADGFDDTVLGALFPTFLRDYGYAVGHLGWTVLAALGLGLAVLHGRRRWPILLIGIAFVALAVADHARANLAGTDAVPWLADVLFDGTLAGWAVLAAIVIAGAHDLFTIRWAGRRDRRYPRPPARSLLPLEGLDRWQRVGAYRRYRIAVFTDLFRLRSTGRSAGDRDGQKVLLDGLRDAASRA